MSRTIRISLVLIFGVRNDWWWLTIVLNVLMSNSFQAGDRDNDAYYGADNLDIRWTVLFQSNETNGDKSIHMSNCCDCAWDDIDIPEC